MKNQGRKRGVCCVLLDKLIEQFGGRKGWPVCNVAEVQIRQKLTTDISKREVIAHFHKEQLFKEERKLIWEGQPSCLYVKRFHFKQVFVYIIANTWDVSGSFPFYLPT